MIIKWTLDRRYLIESCDIEITPPGGVGLLSFSRSMAMRFKAVLSKTTTQSAFSASLFRVSTSHAKSIPSKSGGYKQKAMQHRS